MWNLGNCSSRFPCVLVGNLDDIVDSTGVDDQPGSLGQVGSLPTMQERTEIASAGLRQFQQYRHRENTGPHVCAHRLTQPIGVTDEIEYIVNELERHSEVLSELAKSVDVLIRQLRAERSHPTRAGEERSSFCLDGEQITVDLLTDVE